jgi:hypothetical protein
VALYQILSRRFISATCLVKVKKNTDWAFAVSLMKQCPHLAKLSLHLGASIGHSNPVVQVSSENFSTAVRGSSQGLFLATPCKCTVLEVSSFPAHISQLRAISTSAGEHIVDRATLFLHLPYFGCFGHHDHKCTKCRLNIEPSFVTNTL